MNDVAMKYKEKTKESCELLMQMISVFKKQVDSGIENIDTEEAYKVADIVKDLSETYKNISKALYYETVSVAMEDYEEPEEGDPEEQRYYTRMMRDSRGRFTRKRYHDMGMGRRTQYDDMKDYSNYDPDRDMDRGTHGRMYYTDHDMSYNRDMREGHNGMSRKTYMENPNKENLEKHIDDIAVDVKGLMTTMKPEDKIMVKNKLINLANAM